MLELLSREAVDAPSIPGGVQEQVGWGPGVMELSGSVTRGKKPRKKKRKGEGRKLPSGQPGLVLNVEVDTALHAAEGLELNDP